MVGCSLCVAIFNSKYRFVQRHKVVTSEALWISSCFFCNFCLWPAMSCFADWSKCHHVTLNIIGPSVEPPLAASSQRACKEWQDAQLSLRDRAMRRVSWNLANCHATVQKLLVRQVLNKSKLWSWRVKMSRCVINMCTQPWRVRVAFIVLLVS